MRRRDFLTSGAAAAVAPSVLCGNMFAEETPKKLCHGLTYPSPKAAMLAPREKLVHVVGIYAGTPVKKPDYLATVDLDPESKTLGQVIDRLEMPNIGDELHHFGWNACSSCHGDPTKSRRFLVIPGLRSGRIHFVDVSNPRKPRLHNVIEPQTIAEKTNLSAPHTVHCRGDGVIMISMLGDADGRAPGGFLLLDQDFEIIGRWEKNTKGMHFNYDFWYQPRLNVMVSSEWASPNTAFSGFSMEDVKAGKFGQRLHFWDWHGKEIAQSVDLGAEGAVPLEVRFHHDPDSPHGFVGAALGSSIWHWHLVDDQWKVEKVVQVEPVEKKGWPFPVPGLITDILLSLDDRWLYMSNWLHGDIRQYDISDPSHPRLAGRIWLGGVLGKDRKIRGTKLTGGPQMLQLSLDGKRLYVTNSLFSSWDNQFYPEIATRGSYLVAMNCDTKNGGLSLDENVFVDFGKEPHGPARAHEMRFPGGDCTSDIWV
jgi:selenium-binding protein 1